MPSYDLSKSPDRQRMLKDRREELAAVDDGSWPRNINDRFHWVTTDIKKIRRCLLYDIEYLEARETITACQDCAWTGPAGELTHIRDIPQRVGAGEPMPAGECPLCGALAHLTTTNTEKAGA